MYFTSDVQSKILANFLGFPVEMLRTAMRDCLAGRAGRAQVVEPAVNRRGRAIQCTVNINSLVGQKAPRGVILMMEAVVRDQGVQLEVADRATGIVRTVSAATAGPLLRPSGDGHGNGQVGLDGQGRAGSDGQGAGSDRSAAADD